MDCQGTARPTHGIAINESGPPPLCPACAQLVAQRVPGGLIPFYLFETADLLILSHNLLHLAPLAFSLRPPSMRLAPLLLLPFAPPLVAAHDADSATTLDTFHIIQNLTLATKFGKYQPG